MGVLSSDGITAEEKSHDSKCLSHYDYTHFDDHGIVTMGYQNSGWL